MACSLCEREEEIFSDQTKMLLCLYRAEQIPVPLSRIAEWAALADRRVTTKFAYSQEGEDFYLVTKVYGGSDENDSPSA